MRLVRGFLYIVAALTVLVIAVVFGLRMFAPQLTEYTFVPTAEFTEQPALAANAYSDPQMWFSNPAFTSGDPSLWEPEWSKEERAVLPNTADPQAPTPPFAVFFIHPTSYYSKDRWNAPLDDQDANDRARLFLKGMASPFARATELWAPRYRQAAIGAFLTRSPNADRALEMAYRDVEQAFDVFLANAKPTAPIVLAGHSQGSVHLLHLLQERIAADPKLQQRIAAVYAIGWPISLEHDLPSLGLPPCTAPDQTGCIVSWVSFGEPAEPGQMMTRYDLSAGLDGKPRKGSAILCTNPLTGREGGSAKAMANLGTLVPSADLSTGELVPHAVPATCREDGILSIGDPPDLGPAVLPGNNYHVYDIPLFWENLRQDAERRAAAWHRSH